MTPTWYNTPARVAALEAFARRWEGTPFRENSAVCGAGGGVSCHNLKAEGYFETGFMERCAVPHGRVRSMLQSDPDQLIARVDEFFGDRMSAVDPLIERVLPGDLLAMRITRKGRIMLHLGTVISAIQFVHAFSHSGVLISPLTDPTYQIAAIRRPKPDRI